MRPSLIAAAAFAGAALVSPAPGHTAEPAAAAAPAPASPAAKGPAVPTLFSQLLPDVPGKRLVVVRLKLPPPGARSAPHRHPGSVYVYVTEGVARLGVEGQPVQVVHTGESFFEPAGALHTVAESASATELATAIAVMIVPDGAPLVLPPGEGHQH
jgi:quercetin dioxygenase-like cupin family protein